MSDGLSFGRYQLLDRVAAGGMGEVWVGIQTGIGTFQRPVAVKLLLSHLIKDDRQVKMFLQEARIGAQLSHANVVQVYDVGFEHDRYFIVMELVRGVALSKLIAGLKGAREQLSADLLAYVARALCDGLHVAHELRTPEGQPMRFVHRDVTPHNVLVSVDGAVKLTDFGIARVAQGDRLSRPGTVMGKLGYLPPEQLLGEPVDARADVFSAGATLFSLAACEKPFDAETGSTLDPMRLPTVPLQVLRPDLPRATCEAISRAMQPRLDQRWGSAREFRNALPVASPEAPDALGALVRRICAAALIELEAKTERAEHGGPPADAAARPSMPVTRTAPTVELSLPHTRSDRPAVSPREAVAAPPPAAGSTSSVRLLLPKSRRGLVAWLVLGVCGLAGSFFLLPKGPPPPSPEPVAPAGPASLPAVSAPAAPAVPPPQAMDAGQPDRTPGVLAIDAVPWAEVTLDGKRVGETPLAGVSVTPGAHTLLLKNPETGKTVRRVVQVRPGQRLPIRVDLR